MMKPRWDIFCKIVDNHGDIGVCWRLARQLHAEHGLQLRLWVDDLGAAQLMIPSLQLTKNQQMCDGICIAKWADMVDVAQAAEVVIEAFACGLPATYLMLMQAQNSKWVNLEYLSAEHWVDDFHGKPSPQPNGLTRHFYFPGFTAKTGGLIREIDAFKLDSQIQNSLQSSFPRKRESILVLEPKTNWIPAFAGMTEDKISQGALNISLFCYPHAPIQDLLHALQANQHAAHLFVPESVILTKLANIFEVSSLKAGDVIVKNKFTLEILPFLSQPEYDALLRECDLNFVRGEDSWIRAIWAGKPFIWQPYLQTEETHIQKLSAFIELYYANCEQIEVLWKAHEYWAAEHALRSDAKMIWKDYFETFAQIQKYSTARATQQAEQTDLAAQLVNFCNKL